MGKRILLCLLALTLLIGSLTVFADEETSAQPEELSSFDRVMQAVGMTILFAGIALLPVYFVLDARRKRIRRSFDQKEEGPSDDAPSEEKE